MFCSDPKRITTLKGKKVGWLDGERKAEIADDASKIPERVPSSIEHILFHIHPECQENIDDHRGSDREAGDVYEILPNGECRDPEHLPDPGTDPESLDFNKVFEIVHNTKIFVFQINQGSISC